MDADNLPIDIHCSKLLEWLMSRRHCSQDWQKSAYSIREKINHAIQDMPEHEDIVKLLSGTYINYFHCVKIVDILRETEADSKNIFGYYSSQRMKDWQEIGKLYEKDAVYLAEAAQILQRLVQYEIPGLKKQQAKCRSIQEECDKKEEEYVKLSKEAERNFHQECKKLGISTAAAENGPAKIRNELLRLAENLPQFLDDLHAKISNLQESADYYTQFRQYLLRSEHPESNLVPMLSYVLSKGNTTFFEWSTGQKPDSIEEFKHAESQHEEQDDEIDFGDDEEIDFGSGDNIDFGVESVDSAAIQVVADESGTQVVDKVARGPDAFSVLEHSKTQRLLLQDLYELESFLKSRLTDLNTEHAADFLLASQGSRQETGGAAVQKAVLRGSQEVQAHLDMVQRVLKELKDPYKQHQFKIRRSSVYLGTLTDEIEQKRQQSRKFGRLIELMAEKRQESIVQEKELGPKVDLLLQKTRQLQKQLEADISKRYKGRPVNIMGGISALK